MRHTRSIHNGMIDQRPALIVPCADVITAVTFARNHNLVVAVRGGGHGYLMRTYGMACDNLLSVDVVTAAGRLLTASATAYADLFWAVRSGGGNFGVVTAFEYQLHPVSQLLGGLLVYSMAHAKDVFRYYRDFTRTAPEALFEGEVFS